MGDRRHMVLYEDDEVDPFLYVYTHHAGSGLKETVANGLARGRERWRDEPYLARILVSEMFGPDIYDNLGYGLSGKYLDSEHPDIQVYLSSKRVVIDDQVWDFDEFVRDFKSVSKMPNGYFASSD